MFDFIVEALKHLFFETVFSSMKLRHLVITMVILLILAVLVGSYLIETEEEQTARSTDASKGLDVIQRSSAFPGPPIH